MSREMKPNQEEKLKQTLRELGKTQQLINRMVPVLAKRLGASPTQEVEIEQVFNAIIAMTRAQTFAEAAALVADAKDPRGLLCEVAHQMKEEVRSLPLPPESGAPS